MAISRQFALPCLDFGRCRIAREKRKKMKLIRIEQLWRNPEESKVVAIKGSKIWAQVKRSDSVMNGRGPREVSNLAMSHGSVAFRTKRKDTAELKSDISR